MQDHGNEWIGSAEVAKRLRVNEARVRALIERGALPGRKLANRWLVPLEALRSSGVAARVAGRPFSPKNAWGLLFLASGMPAEWLSPAERSRLRARLQSPKFPLASRFRRRASVNYLRGDDRALAKIVADDRFVRSGVSAASEHDVDLGAAGIVEGYLPKESLAKLSYDHALREVSESSANLIVRAVENRWPFGSGGVAPAAVVAIDLIDSADQRSRRAGNEFLKRIRRRHRPK
ncbi:MAG TPA: helix-turn-helix domain-containing protein [Candidatus Limnocylindria bacterium]|nr:helix-turn-helix domain-containing protein [Candidatus Limnocylindria bacterium]